MIILACGALYHELCAVTAAWPVPPRIVCLAAQLHNHPQQIAPRLAQLLSKLLQQDAHVFVAYADCGSGGDIAKVCAQFGVKHLEGAHCYAFYSGLEWFAQYSAQHIAVFYLTDFLVTNFERTVWQGLGLDKHPQLREIYFAHYTGVVYLQQRSDTALVEQAHTCAQRLALPLTQVHYTGYGALKNLTGA